MSHSTVKETLFGGKLIFGAVAYARLTVAKNNGKIKATMATAAYLINYLCLDMFDFAVKIGFQNCF